MIKTNNVMYPKNIIRTIVLSRLIVSNTSQYFTNQTKCVYTALNLGIFSLFHKLSKRLWCSQEDNAFMYFSCPSTKDYIVIRLAYFDVQRSYCEDQRVLNASLCFVGRFDCKMMFNGIYSVQGYGSSKLSIRFEVR